MLKKAIALWKLSAKKNGISLRRRLLLFFISVSTAILLLFTLILSLFGIDGSQKNNVRAQLSSELSSISDAVESDFGRISVSGISMAEELIEQSDHFFEQHGITASQLQDNTEFIQPLLDEYINTLINVINTRYCGGVFVMLDSSVCTDNDNSRAGIFLKKTQPMATEEFGVDIHCLRGSAQLARSNDIMLLGQWQMEFDTTGQPFWNEVMETARANPDLEISHLYFWTGRIILKNNSEAGFLLCVPLRSADGTVFGVCGIEVSDRMFKLCYTPEDSTFTESFTVMAPFGSESLRTTQGLLAGNQYLSGTRWSEDLTETGLHDDFIHYAGNGSLYGGKTVKLKLYPADSPYSVYEEWALSVLMPQSILHKAVRGSRLIFINTLIVFLILALLVSFILSHWYIKPISDAFEQIRRKDYSENATNTNIPEIDDLFAFLLQMDREHDEEVSHHRLKSESLQSEIERLHGEKSVLQMQIEQVQAEIDRLADSRKNEIDPECYRLFLNNLHTLTPTELIVFNHYLEGRKAKEIMEIMGIKESTLKYHNRNIYSKLGVSSRRELLRYVTIMKQNETNIPNKK